MAPNSCRAIAPQSNMSAHAQMLNSYTAESSPMFPISAKRESQSPLPRHIETPAPRAQSYHTGIDRQSAQSTSALPEPTPAVIAEISSSPCGSPRLKLHQTPSQTDDTASPSSSSTPARTTSASRQWKSRPSLSSSPSSGLKLKLRGIQAALKEPSSSTDASRAQSPNSSHKRTSSEAFLDDDSDTDSEIDIMPPKRKPVKPTAKKQATHTASRNAKKVKATHAGSDIDFDDNAMFDASDEESSPTPPPSQIILSSNVLKRSERILDPNNPSHAKLIAAAPKAGPEYYDSDTDSLPGSVKETNKPHLFRNVKWGRLATDYTDPSAFTTEPEFTQFVPGRFERLPDGTARDQKHKLIIKLTDAQHRARIFANPPPRDWNNQDAITALNKRSVQQIRRNTAVRFREVVEPYVQLERVWILDHLTKGKPRGGWRKFVDAFNREFEGKVVDGAPRPKRSHSSLTKEVERFGDVYSKGLVPTAMVQEKGKGKGKTKKRE